MRVPIRRVGPVAVPVPAYQTAGATAFDLCAALSEPIAIEPSARQLIPTGLALAIPAGFEGQVRPRSGLAQRHGLGIVNSPGTIDQDFRGEIRVLIINLGHEPYVVEPLARIAQLAITPVVRVELELVDELDATERGAGGYGSTGV